MQTTNGIRHSGRIATLADKSHPMVQALRSRFHSPRVRLAAQIALVAICLIPIWRQTAGDWEEVVLLLGQLQAPALIVSAVAMIAAFFFQPSAVMAFTRGSPDRIGYRDSLIAYYKSQPMKYLPGNFWVVPGRVMLLRAMGHDLGLSSAALIFEMATQAFSSALVGAGLLGAAGFSSLWYRNAVWAILVGSLLISLILVVAPALVSRLLPRESSSRQALAGLASAPLASRFRNLVLATFFFVLMWLLMGASFYALVVGANLHLDLALLKASIGVFALSWLVGFLAPFSPGGIGVREGAIVLLLTPYVTGPVAVVVALLSRVLSLVVELTFFAAVWLPRGSATKRAPQK